MNKINTPFTKDQVEYLTLHQLNGRVHPYTCKCESRNPLIISQYGLECFTCGFNQQWAWEELA